jgi:hypothetical protein
MANNDQIILDQILEQQRAQRSPSASKSSFFESYVVEQVLKDADLSDEEIESGLVGDGGDGGIDGIYIFANGDLVREDFDVSTLKKNISLEVVIIQSKTSAGFDEEALNRFVAVTNDLFDLSKTIESFETVYNDPQSQIFVPFTKHWPHAFHRCILGMFMLPEETLRAFILTSHGKLKY